MAELVPEGLIDKLKIDPERVLTVVVEFIVSKLQERGTDGIALGLSGGLDSAVVASIAVRVVEPTRVYAFHLFDRDSQPRFLEYARKLTDKLGIYFEVRDITNKVDELVRRKRAAGGKSRTSRQLGNTALARYLSRKFYYLIRKGYPFVLALRRFGVNMPLSIKRLYDKAVTPTTIGFGPKHIVRRRVLEEYASQKNLLLIGAANRSEALTGWFVEGGIDDLPVEPIMGLYKDQVYQLARFLQVPSEIIDEPPSPDFMAGMTDESMLGLPWEKIDRALYVLENGLDKKVALDDGITSVEFDKVLMQYQSAKKKRGDRHEYPVF